MSGKFHLSDQELLLAADGELSPREAERIESHLVTCWTCRARKQELEAVIADFVGFQHTSFAAQVPASEGPRALLRAQLNQLPNADRFPARFQTFLGQRFAWSALFAAMLIAGITFFFWRMFDDRYARQPVMVTVPNPAYTPGATVSLSQRDVCRAPNDKNRAAPISLQKRVFAEYGIHSAQAGSYELDYLITPALGGADDIHNLWPESSKAAIWNAEVKDALEDRLRDMVCQGQLDLGVAQREIATNWIEAYKKYFHTDRPLKDAE